MPRIIEYQNALKELQGQGMVCNYYNGGAFGFPASMQVEICGWTSGDDPTIRPEMLSKVRPFRPPAEAKMARAAVLAWAQELPGLAWVMPLSHWAFELDFGSKGWLGDVLDGLRIDPRILAARADASPIEFEEGEDELVWLVGSLLENLSASDFMIAFPGHAALCTVHHHKQLWWVSPDKGLIERIQRHGADSAV